MSVGSIRQRFGLTMCVCAIAGVCVAASFFMVRVADHDAVLAAAGVLLAVMLVVASMRYRATNGDLLDPLVLLTGSLAWYFGVHTFWLVANETELQTAFERPFSGALVPSLGLVGLGYGMLVLAFHVPRERRPTRQSLGVWYSRGSLTVVFLVGMAGYAAAASSGAYFIKAGESYSNQLIYKTLGFTAVVAFVVCACQHYLLRKRRTPYGTAMWLMLAVLVTLGMSVGQKGLAFTAIFAWVACRNYTRGYLGLRAIVVAAALGLFVVTPIIQLARVNQSGQYGPGGGSATRVQHAAETIPSRIERYLTGLPDTALAGFDIINRRTDGSEAFALAYRYTPSVRGYMLGEHWPEIFISLIPHYLWPNKPTYNEGEQFSVIYAGRTRASGAGLAVAPTLPGNLYVNFGWPGVLVGMFVLGLLLRVIANARAVLAPTVGVAVYLASMLALVLVEQGVENIGANVLLQLLSTALAFGLLRLATRVEGGLLGSRPPAQRQDLTRPVLGAGGVHES